MIICIIYNYLRLFIIYIKFACVTVVGWSVGIYTYHISIITHIALFWKITNKFSLTRQLTVGNLNSF